jgi:hypothetical protein
MKGYFEWERNDKPGEEKGPQGKGIIRFDKIIEIQLNSHKGTLVVWYTPNYQRVEHKLILQDQEQFYREYRAWLDHMDEVRSLPPYVENVNLH